MTRITADDIKRIREDMELSQNEFAKATGIPQSSLSRFERGEGNLSDESNAKLMQYIETHDIAPSGVTVETEGTETPAENTENSDSDTPTENVKDNRLVDATVNQIIAGYLENLDQTVEAHIKNVRVPASVLFKSDCTISEMEEILATAETKLAGEVGFTLRELLEEIKIDSQ